MKTLKRFAEETGLAPKLALERDGILYWPCLSPVDRDYAKLMVSIGAGGYVEEGGVYYHEISWEALKSKLSAGVKPEANKPQRETCLYRHFNKGGDLLYVGISISAAMRTYAHEKGSHWFRDVETIKVEWFDSPTEALAAEKAAIKEEKPIHNVVHNERT